MSVGPMASDEDGAPRSREVAELIRRIAAIRWFPAQRVAPAAPRVVAALQEHEARAGLDPVPAELSLLSGPEGRRRIASREIGLSRPAWMLRLQATVDRASAALRRSRRSEGHPLFVRGCTALMIRPLALPVSQATLWRRLQGDGATRLADLLVRTLVDRILWELGAAVAWELAADLLQAENPFTALLAIYEEGLYPLDVGSPRVLLWSPAAPEPDSSARPGSS